MKAIFKSWKLIRFKASLPVCLTLLYTMMLIGCSDDKEADTKSPADVIIIVDNSGDMLEEIQAFQNNLYSGFAQRLDNDALDYRIILISKYGSLSDESVCIEAPLSGITDCSNPPVSPSNTTQFYHYSVELNSTNAPCKILETLTAADEYNLAPGGWIAWLRSNSLKFFITLTSDGVDCFSGTDYDDLNSVGGGTAVAQEFNAALTNLSSLHFGSQMDPNYRFYSIIGIPNKEANNPAVPYQTTDPITTSECATAVNPGTGYQGLSILTDGFRFSVCPTNEYGVIFTALADEVVRVVSN